MTTSSPPTDTVSQISNSNLLLHGDAIGSEDWTGIIDDDEFSSNDVAVEEKEDLEQPEHELKPKVVKASTLRIPEPCPLPTIFTTITTTAIKKREIEGLKKLRLLRETTSFYRGICPNPTKEEYICNNVQSPVY